MPWGLKRFQEARCLHFLTFSCYGRAPLLGTARARDIFEHTFEQTRQWYGFTAVRLKVEQNQLIADVE